MTTPAELPAVWRTEADRLEAWGAAAQAATLRHAAEELEAALDNDGGELLKLRGAARLSGYSEDYLARLIKRGALRDYGRRHAPRLRRDDLPIKPGYVLPDEEPLPQVIGTRGRIARAVAHSERGD